MPIQLVQPPNQSLEPTRVGKPPLALGFNVRHRSPKPVALEAQKIGER